MNGPFIVAQANTTSTAQEAQKKPFKVVKVTKPSDGQAITVELGHDQQIKVDLTAIAGENFTLVHLGEKLVILFDNRSTVTIEPYFASRNVAWPNVTFEMSPWALRSRPHRSPRLGKAALPDVLCQVKMPRR